MIYECILEPAFNRILQGYGYGFGGTPDECYANSSTEGWILTVLILLLIGWLLQILFTLLMKKRFLELLIVLEKKFNLYIPNKDSEIENIKLIEMFRLLVIVIVLFLILLLFIKGLALFANYLASIILNETGWALS